MLSLKEQPFCLRDDEIQWVQTTLESMSVEEKIGQLFCPLLTSNDPASIRDVIRQYHPAGVTFRPQAAETLKDAINTLSENTKVPMLISANLENGGVGAVKEGTAFGSQMQIAATADARLAFECGRISAIEASSAGVNLTFSPVIDLDANCRNPITSTRTYGSSPSHVSEMAASFIKGVQENNMAATAKHFPGDGVDFRDHHVSLCVNDLSVSEWDESYGSVYKRCIDQGVKFVMVGHIALPEYSKHLNPELSDDDIMPASLAPELLNQLLREKLGFNGLIISDATTMVGFTSVMERKVSVPMCIEAGCDIFLFSKSLDEDYRYMLEGYNSGILSARRLDEAVTRTLAAKASLGLSQPQSETCDPMEVVGCESHKETAAVCADRSITLVKEKQKILPIDSRQHKRVLLLGLSDNQAQKDNIVAKMTHRLAEQGFDVSTYSDEYLTQRDANESIEAMVRQYDLVIYAACYKPASNKTSLRINWTLPSALNAPWFTKHIPTIFISFGNPYHLIDVPRIPVYVNAYADTDPTVDAVVKKLLGESEFTGSSPVDAFAGMWDTRN